MSKNEKKNKTIKAMIELIEESVFPIDARGRELIAEILYDADFRDVGELREWIDKKLGKTFITTADYEEGFYDGKREAWEEVLNKLESL